MLKLSKNLLTGLSMEMYYWGKRSEEICKRVKMIYWDVLPSN